MSGGRKHLSYRTRRRLALLILVIGLPLYIIVAITLLNWLADPQGRLPFWVELLVFIGLGFLWALPFRGIFRGIGQPDPNGGPDPDKD